MIYFGLALEGMLEDAGHKPGKEERRAEFARDRLMKKVFGEKETGGSGYADPALMFT